MPTIAPGLLLLLQGKAAIADPGSPDDYLPSISPALLLLLGGRPGLTVSPYLTFWDALRAFALANIPDLTAFFLDRARRGVPLPYAVAEDGAGHSVAYMTESPTIREGSASVSFYANRKSQSKAMAAAFEQGIRDAPLRFREGRLMSLRAAQVYGGLLEERPGAGGGKVYRTLVIFDYVYSTPGDGESS